MEKVSIRSLLLHRTVPFVLLLAGCSTTPTRPTAFETWRAANDKAANEFQEAAIKESEFVSKRADNLRVGMTPQEADTVLYRGVLIGAGFDLISSTTGSDSKLEVYRTIVFGGYPDVWLTFYNGKLQTWTVMPQP